MPLVRPALTRVTALGSGLAGLTAVAAALLLGTAVVTGLVGGRATGVAALVAAVGTRLRLLTPAGTRLLVALRPAVRRPGVVTRLVAAVGVAGLGSAVRPGWSASAVRAATLSAPDGSQVVVFGLAVLALWDAGHEDWAVALLVFSVVVNALALLPSIRVLVERE